ncbi:hypothetical protein ACJIZ3_009193 [Penstemon smallii]|uniref:Uncharacterized protein n=1 Tax=Penstemon smallii TaxID=265156 RepID=A0ABD3TDS4_9LAMI
MYIYAPCDHNYYLQVLKLDSQEETFPYLKCIMIHGCIKEPYVMHMVKFLLRSAESFEPTHQSKVFVDTIERRKDPFHTEQLLKLSNELLSFPRSSSQDHSKIYPAPFVCYRFVQV